MLSAALFCCLLFTTASCIHKGDLNLDPVPDIAFAYSSDGLTLTFKSATDNVSNISWISSDGGTGTGDSFVHAFAKPASYWVTMKGTYNGKEETVSTKVLVAKAALVSMTDNSFADWDKVTYEDFQFTGQTPGESPIIKAKMDYDANYIYFYIEFSNTVNAGLNADSAIFSFTSDSDDNTATGNSYYDVGGEYLMEGCLTTAEPWYDFYSGSASAGWTHIDDANWLGTILTIGHKEVTDQTTKMEWAYSRKDLNITSTSFTFVLHVYDGDWNDADIVTYNGSESIHIVMDKQ